MTPAEGAPAPGPIALRELPWHQPAGHHESFSRYVVGLEDSGASIDVRWSRCAPGGSVDSHAHEAAEHVYVFLSGTGSVTADRHTYEVTGEMALYVPPATEHSLRATGAADLVFLVVTSPSGALPR
jgi:mannose-6-phosphate isomerase-like protein (cupin superfamily)